MNSVQNRFSCKEVEVSFWEQYDADHTVVRLATSWSTTEEDLATLEKVL